MGDSESDCYHSGLVLGSKWRTGCAWRQISLAFVFIVVSRKGSSLSRGARLVIRVECYMSRNGRPRLDRYILLVQMVSIVPTPFHPSQVIPFPLRVRLLPIFHTQLDGLPTFFILRLQ